MHSAHPGIQTNKRKRKQKITLINKQAYVKRINGESFDGELPDISETEYQQGLARILQNDYFSINGNRSFCICEDKEENLLVLQDHEEKERMKDEILWDTWDSTHGCIGNFWAKDDIHDPNLLHALNGQGE